jgi:hypothetical protein
MLDLAYDNIEQNGMMPEEFKNKDISQFTLHLNVPLSQPTRSRIPTRLMITIRSKARRRITSKFPRRRYHTSSTYLSMPIVSG